MGEMAATLPVVVHSMLAVGPVALADRSRLLETSPTSVLAKHLQVVAQGGADVRAVQRGTTMAEPAVPAESQSTLPPPSLATPPPRPKSPAPPATTTASLSPMKSLL